MVPRVRKDDQWNKVRLPPHLTQSHPLLTFIRPSFKAGNSQIMLNYKLEIRKLLKSFNDDSLPDGCTLESLECRRMAVAKLIFGKLGRSTNIEAPFFCTWGCNTFIGVNVYMNRK